MAPPRDTGRVPTLPDRLPPPGRRPPRAGPLLLAVSAAPCMRSAVARALAAASCSAVSDTASATSARRRASSAARVASRHAASRSAVVGRSSRMAVDMVADRTLRGTRGNRSRDCIGVSERRPLGSRLGTTGRPDARGHRSSCGIREDDPDLWPAKASAAGTSGSCPGARRASNVEPISQPASNASWGRS